MNSLVVQYHLELILDKKFSDINFSDEKKNIQKFDKTKEFSRVNAETMKTCLHYKTSFLIFKDASGQQTTNNLIDIIK
ncbi:hypothetical protein C1645_787109 [Glomus cerebriforme]|uniref:Uncharacterized protein n=1 Tax=Glomus cerebriforme TaxID=658196 RepID=A0A397SGJ8_9GLOM|nr:hypothetical protein C1645_787109 [Glomus cerebriforme]